MNEDIKKSPVEAAMECLLVVAMGCPQEVADIPKDTPSKRLDRNQSVKVTSPQRKSTQFL